MKLVFHEALTYVTANSICVETSKALQQFKDVRICDATIISLADKLRNEFKGLGGTNSKSSLKIEAVFSVLHKKIINAELFKGTYSDAKYMEKLACNAEKDVLYINDLGYFSRECFSKIASKGAYYISRVKTNTLYYVDTLLGTEPEKTDITKLLKKAKSGVMDTFLWIGSGENRIYSRVVALRLPDEKADMLVKNAVDAAKKKGKTLTKSQKELLRWNIFITNVPQEMLKSQDIWIAYRSRWVIELIFKGLKSYVSIDKLTNVGKSQLLCLIYGKLTFALFVTSAYAEVYQIIYQEKKRFVSILMFFKTLRTIICDIINDFGINQSNIIALSNRLLNIGKKSCYEKRSRKNAAELLRDMYISL